jgi:ElaB/YqjD/DUF883 family membrane-anchored ribosome-binding protein
MPDTNHNHVDDRLDEAAVRIAKAASEWGRDARKRAEDLKTDVAKQLTGAAETLRREARDAKADTEALKHVDATAQHLEKAAVYLKNNSFEQMASTATKQVQQSNAENPWRNLLIVLVIGIIIGLLLRGGRK